MQEYASVLPSDVFAPGAGIATVTAQAAAAADLPASCLVCAGTTGEPDSRCIHCKLSSPVGRQAIADVWAA